MKSTMIVAAALVLVGANAMTTAEAGHPIVKVINLLKGLKEKSIEEGKAEEAQYAKFTYWCSSSTSTLKDAIKNVEKPQISQEKLEISSLSKKETSLTGEINTLTEEIVDNEGAQAQADAQRKKEKAEYETSNKVYKDTVAAIGSAITAMEGAETSTESMLLQKANVRVVLALLSTKVTGHEAEALESYAEAKPDQLAKGDKEAHVDKYDFKSEKVIELLKGLKMKTEDEMIENTKAETNAENAYKLATKARGGVITAEKKAKGGDESDRSGVKSNIASEKVELESDISDRDRDTKLLADTQEQCATRAQEWDARSKTRKDEIAAMDSAMAILAKASDVRSEKNNNPKMAALKFIQVSQRTTTDPKMKAVALIRAAAKAGHSKALERLAQEVQSHLHSPFGTINSAIQKMIFRLMDEQKQEDAHKLWCDKEISKSNTMKDDKADKLAALNVDIAAEIAKVNTLTDDIQTLQEAMQKASAYMAESTEMRAAGKQENKITADDASKASAALANAIAVLNAFYKETGAIEKKDYEFVQAPVSLPKSPAVWESAYSGTADPQDVIIAVLEKCGADFAKLESETKAEEIQDQKAYETMMKDNKIEQAGRAQEVEMKEAEKKRRNGNVNSLNQKKKDVTSQLEKTNQYITDLGPACRDGDSSYDDRKAAREKETAGLRAAQDTLAEAFKAKDTTPKADDFLQVKKSLRQVQKL